MFVEMTSMAVEGALMFVEISFAGTTPCHDVLFDTPHLGSLGQRMRENIFTLSFGLIGSFGCVYVAATAGSHLGWNFTRSRVAAAGLFILIYWIAWAVLGYLGPINPQEFGSAERWTVPLLISSIGTPFLAALVRIVAERIAMRKRNCGGSKQDEPG